MPATAAAITIRPPYIDGFGYADVAVTITDTAGSNVTSYTASGGSTSNTYPTTISAETTFWLVSAGTYLVSAKSGEQEIATPGGSTKSVYAPEPGSGAPTLIQCAQPRDVNESLASQFVALPLADRVDGETTIWNEAEGIWESGAASGTVTSDDITDFEEAVEELISTSIAPGTGIDFDIDEETGVLTISSTAEGGSSDPLAGNNIIVSRFFAR